MLLQMVRFLCFGWSYSILYTTVSLSILPSVDTGCFQVLPIINIAALNIKTMVFFFDTVFLLSLDIFSTIWYGIAISYGYPLFNFLSNIHTVFHSICTNSHFYQQYTSVLSSTSSVTLWISCFFIIVILTGMGRYSGFNVHFPNFW